MPDQTLLDNDDAFDDDGELDMSSFSDAVHAPEAFEDETTTPLAEEQEKEKTMNIRAKLSKRKNDSGTSQAPASKSRKGGIITPVLILLLLVVGVLLLLQVRQLSNVLASVMLSSGSYESSSYEANQPCEYAIDFILDPNLTDRMAARGREGWQVVGSRRTQDSTTGQYGYEFIFMRRIVGR